MEESRKKLKINQKRREAGGLKKIRSRMPIFIGSILVLIVIVSSYFLFAKKDTNKSTINSKKSDPKNITVNNSSQKIPDVYQIDLNKYLVTVKLLEEKLKITEILDSVKVHKTKKIQIASLFDSNKYFEDGSKILILAEHEFPEIPVYIIIEPSAKEYQIISLKDNLPRLSSFKRQLSSKIVRKNILIGDNVIESFKGQVHEDLLSKVENVLVWKTDINRLDSGNIIKVAYEELFYKNEMMGLGKLLAIEWYNKENKFAAYLIPGKTDENGKDVYCTAEGRPLKESFRKSPVNFGRITSRFSPLRFHPKLKFYKAHKGTDFAAAEGSPLLSIGDGIVVATSYTSNNGNFVKVKHNNTYTTQYLHLSRFKKGVAAGTLVRQGDVIGYVGHTGLATGPHVCLRLWKNNEQVDFLKEKFPLSTQIKAFEIELFRNIRSYYSNFLRDSI